MSKFWNIVHECDDDSGKPTEWVTQIDHSRYGKYCWIDDMITYFTVVVYDESQAKELVKCKSLTSAKKWVTMNLME